MMLIRPSNLARFNLVARRHIVASGTAHVRLFVRANTQPLRSLRFKTTSTKTAGPEVSAKYPIPPTVCVYHAGTFKVLFLASLKFSALLTSAIYGLVIVPMYYKQEGLSKHVVTTAISGLFPVLFVTYTTSPIVTFISVRAPPFARQSKAMMTKFLVNIPMQAELIITTMNLFGKPRTSFVKLSELVPVSRRFGIVQMARDTTAENAARKWYMSRPVSEFSVQQRNKSKIGWGWHVLWDQAIAKQR
ncbi:hypothetical protein F5Y12DRAFT_714555 [Xylaria sp. FL1777]|nr:hypothetical protein F5Y12DRAFT_714555 [Xylaria sp. FL1777]